MQRDAEAHRDGPNEDGSEASPKSKPRLATGTPMTGGATHFFESASSSTGPPLITVESDLQAYAGMDGVWKWQRWEQRYHVPKCG